MTIGDKTNLTAAQVREELDKHLPAWLAKERESIHQTAKAARAAAYTAFCDHRKKLRLLLAVLENEENR